MRSSTIHPGEPCRAKKALAWANCLPMTSRPWEATIVLLGALGSVLGHVAQGWEQPERSFDLYGHTTCPTESVCLRREIEEMPREEEGVRNLAFEIGGAIENAWGSSRRRFIARSGPNAGSFDAAQHYIAEGQLAHDANLDGVADPATPR